MFLHSKTTKLKKLDKTLTLLAIITILWTSFFLKLAFAKYDSFFTGFNDLGIYDQVIWNTLQGNLFYSSLDSLNNYEHNFLVQHAELILIFLLPLYYLIPTPKLLIFLQIIAINSSVIPLYLASNDFLKSKIAALIISFSFLLYAPLNWAALFEFNSINLVVPLLFWSLFLLISKRYNLYYLLLTLSLTVKEIVALSTLLLGITLIFNKRSRKIGLITIAISLFWLILTIGIIIPAISNRFTHPLLFYFSPGGSSYGNIIKEWGTSDLLRLIFTKENIRLLFQLLTPLGFLPILGPVFFLSSLPQLLLLFLAQKPEMKLINFHYSSLPAVFFFYALINSFKLLKKNPIIFKVALIILIALSLITNYWYGPSPLSKHFEKPPYLEKKRSEEIKRILAQIPHDKSITTTQRLGSHLSQRKNLYIFPENIDSVDLVIIDTINFPSRPWLIASYQEKRKDILSAIKYLENNVNYQKIQSDQDIVIFKKNK